LHFSGLGGFKRAVFKGGKGPSSVNFAPSQRWASLSSRLAFFKKLSSEVDFIQASLGSLRTKLNPKKMYVSEYLFLVCVNDATIVPQILSISREEKMD
jgi:hypothetical protein